MLEVDAPVPAGSRDARAAAPGSAGWVEERRPLLIAGAFGVAILLGVAIGLLTAPDGKGANTTTVSTETSDPALSPPLSVPPWPKGGRTGQGSAHQMTVDSAGVVRRALRTALAASVRAQSGADRPTADDVTIPTGQLFYGAVEGADAASDVFWAAGSAVVNGVPQAPANPHVWKRVGSGPWKLERSGPGACAALPPALFGPLAWGGTPPLCRAA
jgi:hypothetical protein